MSLPIKPTATAEVPYLSACVPRWTFNIRNNYYYYRMCSVLITTHFSSRWVEDSCNRKCKQICTKATILELRWHTWRYYTSYISTVCKSLLVSDSIIDNTVAFLRRNQLHDFMSVRLDFKSRFMKLCVQNKFQCFKNIRWHFLSSLKLADRHGRFYCLLLFVYSLYNLAFFVLILYLCLIIVDNFKFF